jgi:hypothetical protein
VGNYLRPPRWSRAIAVPTPTGLKALVNLHEKQRSNNVNNTRGCPTLMLFVKRGIPEFVSWRFIVRQFRVNEQAEITRIQFFGDPTPHPSQRALKDAPCGDGNSAEDSPRMVSRALHCFRFSKLVAKDEPDQHNCCNGLVKGSRQERVK